jgi:hypothetical protein
VSIDQFCRKQLTKLANLLLRRNLFTKDDENFTADLQNVSFMSLDESIGKIEVDPKEEASVVKVFKDVLDQLSDSNAMLFKGNFPSCTNLKNLNSLSFFPTSESWSRTSLKTLTKVIWWSLHSVYVWPKI